MVLTFAFAHTAAAADWFVATNGTGGGTNWADATNSLQGMIDDSRVLAGDTVWVSNGVYQTGGVTNYPTGTLLTNRVAITKAITVRSTNGPAVTTIKGDWDPATNGPAAVRCVYMTNGSSLIGFTLTNGATLTTGTYDKYGGGAWCQANAVISNCVLTGNSAYDIGGGSFDGSLYNCTLSGNFTRNDGGGSYFGTLYNCTLSDNFSPQNGGGARVSTLFYCTLSSNSSPNGGGASGGALSNCTLVGNSAYRGGGARDSTLYNCTLSGNSTTDRGGGAYGGSLYNCTLSGNSAVNYGGGVFESTLYNCTVVGNQVNSQGGGVYNGTLYNSIIYFNTAPDGTNWDGAVSFTNSCTTTAQVGWAVGNITADPSFMANGSNYGTNHVAGNYRLSANSPCINAGTNFSWMTITNDVRSRDLDGNPRIRYQTVDMGAYETLLKGTVFSFH